MKDISPYNLLQERFRDKPWQMMILCIMLNQTSYKQVDKVRDEFFRRWPTPYKAAKAMWHEITKVIRPLGFYNRRTKTIIEFSKQYGSGNWADIGELYGIGKYARDSWMIFQEGKIPNDVTDKQLKKYVSWANSN